MPAVKFSSCLDLDRKIKFFKVPLNCKERKMATEIKPVVSYDETFAKLDIRVGRVVEVELETRTHKQTYRMVVDFGKYGKRVSYGRFTCHSVEEVKDRLVLGVLNFDPRPMGPVTSEVLIVGVQYPKAESGEATFVSPAVNAKIGSKLF
jgi:tRNA-binding protein